MRTTCNIVFARLYDDNYSSYELVILPVLSTYKYHHNISGKNQSKSTPLLRSVSITRVLKNYKMEVTKSIQLMPVATYY
jgi:hypothetical protein